jgi:hypothetical protein
MAKNDIGNKGHVPEMDLILREDTSTDGTVVRSLAIETSVVFPDAKAAAFQEVRSALAELKTRGARSVYEAIYRSAKDHFDKAGPAHAVLQATFGQITVDESKIPKVG